MLLPLSTRAQENERGTPPSFQLKTSSNARQSFPTYTTDEIPLDKLQAEDAIFDKGKYPYRFGYNFNVNLDIKKEGTLEELADGSKIWRYKVKCPGAISVNFLYSNFHLPEGSKLF
ncbi:MAG: hypothetical protein H7282_03055 [Cytophagaceae bacterium]|nr:hypothetical protein [Cytophagaceae bacterium]